MRGLAFIASFLILAGVATAARGEPQRAITPADQARAKAMLVRKADLGSRFAARQPVGSVSARYCAAVDQSDLTLTGAASSPVFATSVEFVSSQARVFDSEADASASWSRMTSAAGVRCTRTGLVGRVASFERLALPASLGTSVAYRVSLTAHGRRGHLVLVALVHGRAQAALVYESVVSQPATAVVTRLATRVAQRMRTAMRGS